MEELYLQNRFNFFVGKISDVVNSLDFKSSDGVDLEAITAFSESLKEAEKARYQCKRLPFPTFFKDVYPAYLEAMVTKEDYYLSDIELLALAHCTAQNVAIFVHFLGRHQLTYARSYIAKPELPVIVTCLVDSHGQGAARAHFERLSLSFADLHGHAAGVFNLPGSVSLAPNKSLPSPKRSRTFTEALG